MFLLSKAFASNNLTELPLDNFTTVNDRMAPASDAVASQKGSPKKVCAHLFDKEFVPDGNSPGWLGLVSGLDGRILFVVVGGLFGGLGGLQPLRQRDHLEAKRLAKALAKAFFLVTNQPAAAEVKHTKRTTKSGPQYAR